MVEKEIRNTITSLNSSCKKAIKIFQKSVKQNSLTYNELIQLNDFLELLKKFDIPQKDIQKFSNLKTNSSKISELRNSMEKLIFVFNDGQQILSSIDIYKIVHSHVKFYKRESDEQVNEVNLINKPINRYDHLSEHPDYTETKEEIMAQLDVWKEDRKRIRKRRDKAFAKYKEQETKNSNYYKDEIFNDIIIKCTAIITCLTEYDDSKDETAPLMVEFEDEKLYGIYEILIGKAGKDNIIEEIFWSDFCRIMKNEPCKEKIRIIEKKGVQFCVALDFLSQLVDVKKRTKWVNSIIINFVDGVDKSYYWKKYRSYNENKHTKKIRPKSIEQLILKLRDKGFQDPKNN